MLRVPSCCHLATGVIQLGYITLTALKVSLRTSGVHMHIIDGKEAQHIQVYIVALNSTGELKERF